MAKGLLGLGLVVNTPATKLDVLLPATALALAVSNLNVAVRALIADDKVEAGEALTKASEALGELGRALDKIENG